MFFIKVSIDLAVLLRHKYPTTTDPHSPKDHKRLYSPHRYNQISKTLLPTQESFFFVRNSA